jgi:hypothetical protein
MKHIITFELEYESMPHGEDVAETADYMAQKLLESEGGLNVWVRKIEQVELPDALHKPCNDCPWRRNAAPGWLGPYTAEEWVQLAHSDEPIACHLTIEVEDSWEEGVIRQCAGAAIYRANVCKSPRNPEVVVLPSDTETVFATPNQFMDYHDRGLAEDLRIIRKAGLDDGQ